MAVRNSIPTQVAVHWDHASATPQHPRPAKLAEG